MINSNDVQRLRAESGDEATYNSLLQSNAEFRQKVERVESAYPNMTPFEKRKFPTAMLDIQLGVKRTATAQAQTTSDMVNSGMTGGKGAWQTLTEDPLKFAGQTGKNILPSAGRLLGGVASAAAHPLQTGKTLFQLGVGGAANTLESLADLAGVKNAEEIFDLESEEVASAVGDFYVERYGSLEAAATTLRDDPAGFLSDLGAVVTGVGGVLKGGASAVGATTGAATRSATQLSALGKGVRTAQQVGSSMMRAGVKMEPIVIAGKGVVKLGKAVRGGVKAIGKSVGASVMATKALKLNPSDIQAFRNLPGNELPGDFLLRKGILDGGELQVTATEGIQMTATRIGGRMKSGIVDDLEKIAQKAKSTVDNELASVRQAYDIVDEVPTEVSNLIDEIESAALKYDLKDELALVSKIKKTGRATLSELNEVKRVGYDLFRTYRRSNQAMDSLRAEQINRYERGLRAFIEDEAVRKGLPDVGILNQDTMKSREILDAIEKAEAASWSKGKLTFGLMDGMFGIGGFAITQDWMMTAGIVVGRRVLESTLFKTTMAKWIDRLDPTQIKILKKAFESGRHTKESRQVLRKVVAQTAEDIQNKRIGDMEDIGSIAPALEGAGINAVESSTISPAE